MASMARRARRSSLVRWGAATVAALVLVAGAVLVVLAWVSLSSIDFPADAPGPRGAITEGSVYASVREVAGTDDGGACRRTGVRPARFRCALAGRGVGPLRYRVVVSRVDGCWHARGVGFQPLHGCIPRQASVNAD
jgi:hypothetical protein